MKKLTTIISYIASHSTELKNKYTNELRAPIEFVCIFCQNNEEYGHFTNSIKALGKVVENTKSGFTYLLDKPIRTVSGPLKLIKIRKPDSQRSEKGDADFNTNYREFRKKYKNNPRFELVKRETFEMLRLSDPAFDVMACFSNLPKSKDLGIKLS